MPPTQLTVTREIAYDAFIEVMEHQKNPDEITELLFNKQKQALKRKDRNLVKEILFGGLRWYAKINWILQKTSKRDLKKTSPQIRAALILGTYQIFYMDRMPDRAAVNESVEYIRKKGQANAVKFVNGILRSIARRAEYFSKPDKETKPCDYLALQYAHPRWMVERWFRRFSFDRIKDLLSTNNHIPPHTIRLNTIKISSEDIPQFRSTLLKEDKNQSERKSLRSCLQLKNAPNVEEDSLFAKGFYTIQDESSQLVANLVAPEKGQTIVDACTGKGGKLGHLYEISRGEAQLVAVDKDAAQLSKAKETMERLGHGSIKFVQEDFLQYAPQKGTIDKILLDSPCSALGVLRRHPEGKWQKSLTIIPKMAEIQRKLIQHSLDLLPQGGELIYSVCSFEPEETLDHLTWLHDEYQSKIEVVTPLRRLPDYYKRFVTRENMLLIFSGNKDEMDGFGAFILRKISSF